MGALSNDTPSPRNADSDDDDQQVGTSSAPALTIRVEWLREQSGSVTDENDAPKPPLYAHNASSAGKKSLKWRYRARFSDRRADLDFYIARSLTSMNKDESKQRQQMHAAMTDQLKSSSPDFANAEVILRKE